MTVGRGARVSFAAVVVLTMLLSAACAADRIHLSRQGGPIYGRTFGPTVPPTPPAATDQREPALLAPPGSLLPPPGNAATVFVPAPSSQSPCVADAGGTVIAFFADLTAGRADLASLYFIDSGRALKWVDPAAGQINASTGGLAALQRHIEQLQGAGVTATVVAFNDDGVSGDDSTDVMQFDVDLSGTSAIATPVRPGHGSGEFDCVARKIMVLVISAW